MKNQSHTLIPCIVICLSLSFLSACSSSKKKENPPPPVTTTETLPPAGPDVFAPENESKLAGPAESVQIPTSDKKLTPTRTDDPLSITLKPDIKKEEAPALAPRPPKPAIVGVEPSTSLRWLKNGNTRFSKGWLRKDGQAMKDIKRVVNSHRPHAVVVASSDARVPPELVFDQKLGEIFTVRTLGPSLSPEVIASVEYALMHLGTRNIVILGHSSCGGAKIAFVTMDGTDAGSENLKSLVNDIQPRIRSTLEGKSPSKNFLAECWANTQGVAEDLKNRSALIKEGLDGNQFKISSALYDLETGKVEFR